MLNARGLQYLIVTGAGKGRFFSIAMLLVRMETGRFTSSFTSETRYSAEITASEKTENKAGDKEATLFSITADYLEPEFLTDSTIGPEEKIDKDHGIED